jgi:tetratricopeptide (TPR) repeat protein
MASGLLVVVCSAAVRAQTPQDASPPATLDIAKHLFYSGRYEEAMTIAGALRATDGLAAYELRTAALHFQIKRLLGDPDDKAKALKACADCAALMDQFTADIADGKAQARAALAARPKDESATYFLGKLDLNYVWLQLSTLGRKTGWGEYWEARRSLDAVLKMNPNNVRARVARAWIDYIVDTRVPFALRWLVGGGDKKRALRVAREAADADAEFFVKTEAGFALWEMYAREKNFDEAVVVARRLAAEFPTNRELMRFLADHDKDGPPCGR